MTTDNLDADPESNAHRLVGKFLQSFAEMEHALDLGIGKILGLNDATTEIVGSSIPFAKKIGVFFSAEGFLAAMPDDDRKNALNETRSKILDLNTKRVMFAHCRFFGTEDGITLKRVVADKKLIIKNIEITSQKIIEYCEQMARLAGDIEALVVEMKPYVPTLDFRDPRNSGLIALIT